MKFSAVNVVATAVAIALFNLLVHGLVAVGRPGPLNGWPLTAWFIAHCVGMAISFYGSRRYAFRHRRPYGPGGGAVAYVVVNLASFAIPMTCLWVTRNVLGWDSALADNVSGNVVGAFLGMLVRFWAFRTFVFKRPPRLRHDGRESGRSASVPQLGPDEPELLQHQPEQRKADAHDVVGIARHARDEGATETVEGEGPRHG